MYVYIEVCSDLCILDPLHIVIPFSPLCLHILLFTIVHILWNVISVTRVYYISWQNLHVYLHWHMKLIIAFCSFMNIKEIWSYFLSKKEQNSSLQWIFISLVASSIYPFISCVRAVCHQLHTSAAVFHFMPRAMCLSLLHYLTFCVVGSYRSSNKINCYWQFTYTSCSTHSEWMRGGSG